MIITVAARISSRIQVLLWSLYTGFTDFKDFRSDSRDFRSDFRAFRDFRSDSRDFKDFRTNPEVDFRNFEDFKDIRCSKGSRSDFKVLVGFHTDSAISRRVPWISGQILRISRQISRISGIFQIGFQGQEFE